MKNARRPSMVPAIARRFLLDNDRPILRRVGRQLLHLRRRMNRIDHYGRPAYRECVVEGAKLAVALGHERITVVEFGVATGNGLVALERIAERVEQLWPVRIDVVGFDLGSGLPPPTDYRDLPWHWSGGDYPMDEPALRARLSRSELVIGDIATTLPEFMARSRRLSGSPVGAAIFDLDYYSSTTLALQLLEGDHMNHLPRIQTYFDDLRRTNRYTGEWCAIEEFNDRHEDRKVVFRFDRIGDVESRQILEFHHFGHPDYSVNPTSHRREVPKLA